MEGFRKYAIQAPSLEKQLNRVYFWENEKQVKGEGVVNTKSGDKIRQNLFKITVDQGE